MSASAQASAAGRAVVIPGPGVRLRALLTIPPHPAGLVLFAHGSGSSRLSPRNQFVAAALNAQGLATLLLDLLDAREEGDRGNVFDIPLLADRLAVASDWAAADASLAALPMAYFGASTGAAVALRVAAEPGRRIAAVVSRGGRPDLAMEVLPRVTAPTLLIVGSFDDVVVELNRSALAALRCEKRLSLVLGATHLFEEPGTLEQVARLAGDWLLRHCARAAGASRERPA